MATTASDIQAQAAVEAWLKSQTLKDMQKSIEDAYNAGVGQATASNEQILNQLNANLEAYNKQYEADARSAYLNKMQGDMLLNTQLSSMGLDNSGYGVSQKLANQGIYSQNLNSLKMALGKNVADIDLAKANQAQAYQAELQKLLQSKASAQYDYNKYVADMSEEIRQQAISNYLQNKYYDYLYSNLNKSNNPSDGLDLDVNKDKNLNLNQNQNDTGTASLESEKMKTIVHNLKFVYDGAYRQYAKKGYNDKDADSMAREIQKYDIQNMYDKGQITKEEFLLLAEKYGF